MSKNPLFVTGERGERGEGRGEMVVRPVESGERREDRRRDRPCPSWRGPGIMPELDGPWRGVRGDTSDSE